MNELIKTFKQNDGSVAVDGRDLHDFLEVETPYTKWIDRMMEYGFAENVDFSVFDKNVHDDASFEQISTKPIKSFTEKRVKPKDGRLATIYGGRQMSDNMYHYGITNKIQWIKLKRASEPVEDWINVDQIQAILSQDDPGEIRIILAGNTVGNNYNFDFDKVPELLIKLSEGKK